NNIAGVKEEFTKKGIHIEDIMAREIKSGDDTLFWLDKWQGAVTLKEAFPDLFQLERHKHCRVKDRVVAGSINWSWKSATTAAQQVSSL
ncbi:hypothetical protein, partial [Pseudomonas syringae]|uniref:hypothetical protein n=1 Tax=Pseudomonas syringae TaxID=317 RepID=UPI0034D4F2E2